MKNLFRPSVNLSDIALLAVVLMFSPAAIAQEPDAEPTVQQEAQEDQERERPADPSGEAPVAVGGDEIVVTARMREESAQEIPLSETVFSEQQIKDARIDRPNQLIALTPNVTLADSQSVGVSFMTIRGITQVRNGEPPVAVVVDGVLQSNTRFLTQELFDIEHVEILRGPQGALYGRNATGGAIIIETRQPTNDFEGHVRVGLGEGDERVLQGTVSGPLVANKLLFRLSGRYLDREGYFTNVNLNQKADPVDDLTVRGQLTWLVNNHLTADLRVNTSRFDGGGFLFQYQPAIIGADGASLDPTSPFPFDFSIADADLVDRKIKATNAAINEREIDEVSLKLQHTSEKGTFTSVTSRARVLEFLSGDQFPYTAALTSNYGFGSIDGGQTQYVDVKAWSEELRFSSPGDRRARWMAGLYYLQTDRFISTSTSDDLGLGVIRIEHEPVFDDPTNPTLSFFADDNDNKAWAVFGNTDYDLSDELEFSLALRYDRDERKQFVLPTNTGGVPGAVNKKTFDKLQPKVSLRHKVGDDAIVYGSWGVGFRSGQFNQNGVGAAAAAVGLEGVEDSVDQEETQTFELGFKSEWLDHRLRLNGSVYRTDVDGQHYFVFIGPVSAQVLVNVDDVQLVGGELEAVAKLGSGFDAYAAVGLTDSEIKKYSVNPSAVGNQAPYVPEFTFNAGIQYRTDIAERFGIFGRADFEHRGSQFWDPENTTARSDLDLVSLRFGIENSEKGWSLVGSMQNATDEVYNSEWVLGGFSHPGLPRTWHLDLRIDF